MVEHQPSKLNTWVRFPSPALDRKIENARVAQLVEHDLAKVGVAGSSPVSRSREVRKTLILRAFLMPESVQKICWTEVGQIRRQI